MRSETNMPNHPLRCTLMLLLLTSAALVGCESTPNPVFTFAPAEQDILVADWTFDGVSGVHIVTENFDIYTTTLDQGLEDYLPGFLEATLEYYKSIIPPPDNPEYPVERLQTYLFDSRKDWETFSRRRHPSEFELFQKISNGGYSQGADSVCYDIGRSATLSLLAHEGMHQYLATHFDTTVPAWVNEGLASYCECVDFSRDEPQFTPGRNTFRINHLRGAIKQGPTYTLNELLATNAGRVIDTDDGQRTTSYYAHVWGLVLFLRHGANGKYASSFEDLLDGIVKGDLRIRMQSAKVTADTPSAVSDGEAAFRAYITTDLASFEIEYRDFLYDLCYPRDPVRIDIGWQDRLMLE